MSFLFLLMLFTVGSANECGKVDHSEGLILGGTQTVRGEWPFIVALYYVETGKFFCGATLISSKHTLTAAHCVQQKSSSQKLLPEDVVALLGRYNLELKIESGAHQADVDEIYVHPDWKIYSDKYDADLAIFVLRELVDFSHLIRPVCLPADDEQNDIANIHGSIVGWGIAENKKQNMEMHEFIPRHAFTSILNDSYCYTTNHLLAVLSSQRTFCGSGEDGTANKGDSGGGFFVFSSSYWVQYGIISSTVSNSSGAVQADAVAVYTNVKSFKSWISEIVENTMHIVIRTDDGKQEGVVTTLIVEDQKIVQKTEDLVTTLSDTNKEKINLNCVYNVEFKCTLVELDITKSNIEVVSFTDVLFAYKNQNVESIYFSSGILAYIPDGIGKLFKHLNTFVVDINLGLKLLKRPNFKNMPLLNYINVTYNDIEYVDEDTLWDLPKLESFVINNNKLKILHEKTFEKNTNLIYVNAASNKLEFLHKDLFKTNLLLEWAIFSENDLATIATDFLSLTHIQEINFRGNICIDNAQEDVESVAAYLTLIKNQCS